MILGCKLSGDVLSEGAQNNEVWTEAGLLKATEIVGAIQAYITQPNDHQIDGAIVVVGGGNGGFRGRELVEKHKMKHNVADRIGLTGTMINTIAVAGALEEAGVEHDFLVSPGLRLQLPDLDPDRATPRRLHRTFKHRKAALIGGGSARYKQSTDSAVINHLEAYRKKYKVPVMSTKATKYGAVFEADPRAAEERGEALPARYRRISTAAMRELELFAIDLSGINTIEEAGIPMILHDYKTNPVDALENAGTVVVPSQEQILELV